MALGKGLGSLIPPKVNNQEIRSEEKASSVAKDIKQVLDIPLSKIDVNPLQPRQHINHKELEDLVRSIREHGVLQPVVVTETETGYELVAGERRLRASKIAGLKTIPAITRNASDLEKLELALIENIQRSDLNPIEKAQSYDKLVMDFGLTQDQAAKKMGISRSAFANTVRLLGLPEEIQIGISEGKITEGHAKVILSLPNKSEQLKFFRDIVENKMSVRSLESEISEKKPKKRIPAMDPQLEAWTEELQNKLKTKAAIQKKGEKGRIVIDFYSEEELSEIMNNLID
ncbi:MAG: ParB/RepB/Spo0J family partition protein [Patescibacteria group bacterium]|nr:ParB/RepB/Spo0J family partition protein [Patescibacteria group bacterium]